MKFFLFLLGGMLTILTIIGSVMGSDIQVSWDRSDHRSHHLKCAEGSTSCTTYKVGVNETGHVVNCSRNDCIGEIHLNAIYETDLNERFEIRTILNTLKYNRTLTLRTSSGSSAVYNCSSRHIDDNREVDDDDGVRTCIWTMKRDKKKWPRLGNKDPVNFIMNRQKIGFDLIESDHLRAVKIHEISYDSNPLYHMKFRSCCENTNSFSNDKAFFQIVPQGETNNFFITVYDPKESDLNNVEITIDDDKNAFRLVTKCSREPVDDHKADLFLGKNRDTLMKFDITDYFWLFVQPYDLRCTFDVPTEMKVGDQAYSINGENVTVTLSVGSEKYIFEKTLIATYNGSYSLFINLILLFICLAISTVTIN